MKKRWINMNTDKEEVVDQVEEKEEEKMSFFAKHKKGILIGGLGTLAAGVVGLLIANKKSDDDEYEMDLDDDDLEDEVETDSGEES